jgi:hypothetical protein
VHRGDNRLHEPRRVTGEALGIVLRLHVAGDDGDAQLLA